MPEPSDASNARPFNRIAPHVPAKDIFGKFAQAIPPDGTLEAGTVVNLGQPGAIAGDIVPEVSRATTPELDSLAKQLDRESSYGMWYDLAQHAVASGEDPAEIRAQFLDMAASVEGTEDVIREALQDALAGRPPRYKNPWDPR